jgi:vacuolar-type H+-ATPase subunit I/STV1
MKRWLLLIFTSILILAGCSSNEGSNSLESSDRVTDQTTEQSKGSDAGEENSSSAEATSELPELLQERKVIFNATLSLSVEDLTLAINEIKESTKVFEGYVVEESTFSEDNAFIGSMTVRIPQSEFDAYLRKVESLGKGSPQKAITGSDVTEEYVDLSSRLKAKEAVQQRLESFLNEATKTDDLLAISNELSRVQEEVEQLKGQINYLENQSDYSTVTISLEQKKRPVPSIGERDFETLSEAKHLFITTSNGLLAFFSKTIVLLIGLSPILLPLLIIGLFFLYRFRKKT